MENFQNTQHPLNKPEPNASPLFSEFKSSKSCYASVVIPVRNEAKTILASLQAFIRQKQLNGKPIDFECFELLVLANNCTDNSVDLIRKFQQKHSFLHVYLTEVHLPNENANIGYVRRLLMNDAYQRLRNNALGAGVIMTTDSDSVVADQWIISNLKEISAGADAVGGRITINSAQLRKMDKLCREVHLLDDEYRLLIAELEGLIDDLPFDVIPRHYQHFNASFAVTTQIYEKAGGIPDVKILEDCAFYDRLQNIDAKVRHSFNVNVYTSSRHIGRCEMGLSHQFNIWKTMKQKGETVLVEAPAAIIKRLTLQQRLRKLWLQYSERKLNLNGSIRLAEQLLIPYQTILLELEKKAPFGIFYRSVRQAAEESWYPHLPLVPVEIAIDQLKKEIKQLRLTSSAKYQYDNAPSVIDADSAFARP